MKSLVLILTIMVTNLSMASISNTALEKRHQDLIERAIEKNCGNFKNLTEIYTTSEVIQIDNGIQDVKYKSVLTGLQRLDQNIFDSYIINVDSEYSDMYDHSSKEWGVFSVTNVKCSME